MRRLSKGLGLLTHKAGGIVRVSAHFPIDFDEALVDDCNDLASG